MHPSDFASPSRTNWLKIAGGGFLALVILVFLWIWLVGSYITVDPGQEAVLVDQPRFFGPEGVRKFPATEGRTWIWSTTKAYYEPTVPQSVSLTLDDFNTNDGVPLDFNMTFQYRIIDTVKLVDKFGPKWFANNIQAKLLGIARDGIKARKMPELMSDQSTAQQLDQEITDKITEIVKSAGIPIQVMDITLGRARPNAAVLTQMDATAAQQQRKRTLELSTAAEVQRKEEQSKRAEADNAYREKMNLSPEQFVALEIAKQTVEACKVAKQCVLTPSNASILVNH